LTAVGFVEGTDEAWRAIRALEPSALALCVVGWVLRVYPRVRDIERLHAPRSR
jgi:hypothetical protein